MTGRLAGGICAVGAALLGTVLVASTPAAAATSGYVVFKDTFEAAPLSTSWLDGRAYGTWTSVYNGYGTVGIQKETSKVLYQSPKASRSPGETHASLTRTTRTFTDLDLTLNMKTVKQLRTGSAPNPWETAWVLWNYTNDTHFYYFTLKLNGWELGKEDPAYPGAQRFLATGSNPRYPIARWHTVRIRQVGATIEVWANGTKLTTFTDRERPYTAGSVALYNEDAHVRFDNVQVAVP